MRIAYLDCASGISGDMTLGALVDAGISIDEIQAGIDSLGLPSCRLVADQVTKKGFRATHVRVEFEPEHKHRHLHQIVEMIESSNLSSSQQQLAVNIFTRLGQAEAKVHGTSIEKVHFHEVGAVDSIADIVGSAIGWDLLNVQQIVASPIPTGSGFVQIAHGRVSVPAPATAELLRQIPLAPSAVEAELTTPTGAAIAATLVAHFGPLPAMCIEQIGYGAGSKDLEHQPNVLRLIIGQSIETPTTDTICQLETNLDDVPGEWIGYATERLMESGALDVFTAAIQMKKNRPATLLTVICRPADAERLERLVFQETGSLGIRRRTVERSVLARRACRVETEWGTVEGKLARLADGQLRFAPEFDSCRQLASDTRRALPEVYRAAQLAFDLSDPPISW